MENNLIIPDSVDNAAKNLSDKPTLAIGQTIADLWEIVLGGRVAFTAEKRRIKYAHDLEEYRKTLEGKVSAIPADKQTEPPLQIAAQALEDSKYCIEAKELRELFANLISRAMHSDYSSKLHPSFSKIAQQLSPLDAQMLSILRKWQPFGGIAVVDYNEKSDSTGYHVLSAGIPEIMPSDCTEEAAARSLVSLQRLGLIDVPTDVHFTSDTRYAIFKESPLYKKLNLQAKRLGRTINMNKRIAKLSVLGEDFVSVCLD